jgi:hypothetical protein
MHFFFFLLRMDVFFVREKLFFYIVGTTVFKDKNNFRTILFNLMFITKVVVYLIILKGKKTSGTN